MSQNSKLQQNTFVLQAILSTVNALPNAGEGREPVIEALSVTENGAYTAPIGVDGYSPVTVNVPIPDGYIKPSGLFTIRANGIYDIAEYAEVNVEVPTGGGDSNNYVKFTATTDSSTSFIIENPLGGIAKKVSIKAISPTITSSRKIHECCLDWDIKLGAVKAYYSSGNVTYTMTGVNSTPNNGNFRMTDGFITAYRFNSATSWDTSCDYEVEIYQ